jgi:hypothetical protein
MEAHSPFQQSAQPVNPGSGSAKLAQGRSRHKRSASHFVGPSHLFRFFLEQASLRTVRGNGLLRQAAARSFLTHTCKRKNQPPNQRKKPVRGLDNVGFIAASRLTLRGIEQAGRACLHVSKACPGSRIAGSVESDQYRRHENKPGAVSICDLWRRRGSDLSGRPADDCEVSIIQVLQPFF